MGRLVEAVFFITLLEAVVDVEAGNDLLRLEQGHVTKVVPLTTHVTLIFDPVLLVFRPSDPDSDGFESGRSRVPEKLPPDTWQFRTVWLHDDNVLFCGRC